MSNFLEKCYKRTGLKLLFNLFISLDCSYEKEIFIFFLFIGTFLIILLLSNYKWTGLKVTDTSTIFLVA